MLRLWIQWTGLLALSLLSWLLPIILPVQPPFERNTPHPADGELDIPLYALLAAGGVLCGLLDSVLLTVSGTGARSREESMATLLWTSIAFAIAAVGMRLLDPGREWALVAWLEPAVWFVLVFIPWLVLPEVIEDTVKIGRETNSGAN